MVLLAQGDDLADGLGVETGALRLGVDFLDVAGDARLLLLKALDTLNERLQLVGRDRLRCDRILVQHGSPSIRLEPAGVPVRARRVKATVASMMPRVNSGDSVATQLAQ